MNTIRHALSKTPRCLARTRALVVALSTGVVLAQGSAPASAQPASAPAAAPAAAPKPAHRLTKPSTAPDANAKKQAAHAEKDAKTLATAGDCGKALPLFVQAYELAGSETALAGAVDCHEKLGQLVEAYDLASQLLSDHTAPDAKSRPEREQRVKELAAKTAVLNTDAPDGAAVEIDGVLGPAGAGLPGVRVLPGQHRVAVSKPGQQPFETSVSLAPGQSLTVPVSLAPAAVATPVDKGEVQDFCYMKPPADKSRYQKQKLVLFSMAGRNVVDGPEGEENLKGEKLKGVEHHVLRDLNFHSHARNVFLSTFPLDRFYMVNALAESPGDLKGHAQVGDVEMIRAAGTDAFAAYSIACADWVVLPRVASKDATWKPVKKTKMVNNKSVEYLAWDLSVVWGLEADVYHHVANGWQLSKTVVGSNGGFFGLALSLAAAAPQKGNMPPTQLVSKRPDPTCSVPLLPALNKFTDGMKQCHEAFSDLSAKASAVMSDSPPAGAESAPGTVPSAEQIAKQAVDTAAAGALNQVPNGNGVAPQLTEQEKSALAAAKGHDPMALAPLAMGAAASANPALAGAAASAQVTVTTCKQPIEAVAEAHDELRKMVTNPGAAAFDAAVGLAACSGLEFTADLSTATAPGTAQRRSSFCEHVIDEQSAGAAAMESVARCEARVAVEGATLGLQKAAKQLDGWRMFAVLKPIAQTPDDHRVGISLGQSEGLRRGDLYVAFTPSAGGAALGYGRILDVGPGGPDGDAHPSQFKFRSGEADVGARMEEHPQVGVPLGLRPQVDYLLSHGSLDTTLAYGAALEGGYNASPFVPVGDEVWGKIYLSYLLGSSNESFAAIELMPEIVHFLGSGFAVYGTSGFVAMFAIKELKANSTFAGKNVASDTSLSGFTYGAELGAGIDYSVSPDWDLKLSALYRQGLARAKLEDKSKTYSMSGGSLAAAQGALSLAYTF
jgi:hypothetical protein